MTQPATNISDLQGYLADLRVRRNYRYGYLGEDVFQSVMRSHGCPVQSSHRDGADFVLDGKERVDVKTRLCLGSMSGEEIRQLSPTQCMPDTTYAYVTLYDDVIQVHMARPGEAIALAAELSWTEVLRIYVEKPGKGLTHTSRHESRYEEARKTAKADLIGWVAEHWRMKAKVVLRSTRMTQEKMGRSGWGPEAFYHDPDRPRGVELVVLLYFDHDTIYEVCAYPMSHSRNIEWRDKPVGPNLSRRKTFDPVTLPDVYKFPDLEAFKQEFRDRFGSVSED